MKCDSSRKRHVLTGCVLTSVMVSLLWYFRLDLLVNRQSRPSKFQPNQRIEDVTLYRKRDYVTEEECQSMIDDVLVAPAYSMPLTALASFPRSGNAWTRSLIQVATKHSTGILEEKKEDWQQILANISKGIQTVDEESLPERGICVKIHNFSQDVIQVFNNGAILLIRNPYYSIVSEYFRFCSGVKNISRKSLIVSMETKSPHWTRRLYKQFDKWKTININWITYSKRVLVVFFEDLEKHTVRELSRMVAFLGQPILPRRILCAVQNFKPLKKHGSQMEFDPYTPQMRSILDAYIQEVNETLISRNVNPLPTYERYF